MNREERSRVGLPRMYTTPRIVQSHPRLGGSRGYDVAHRQDILNLIKDLESRHQLAACIDGITDCSHIYLLETEARLL